MLFHTIKLNSGNSDIYLQNGLIHSIGEITRKNIIGKRAVIVSDSNVAPLYAKIVKDSLEKNNFKVNLAVFDAGEQSKTLQTVEKLYCAFNEAAISRSDVIIALGGGVVGDITGFAAATYLRGVPFVQVPTTLLAQIDSSIGGKTGVDLPFGKNLVGAFYQPKAIITDSLLLKTLPKKYMNDGLAEAIKYGCIKDDSIFNALENGFNEAVLEEIIKKSILIKSGVVERDVLDLGERMLLNFGHTFGHSIEKCQNYVGLSHGEAVAVGMVIASNIGERLNLTKEGTTKRIKALLEKYDLPTSVGIEKNELFKAIGSDKKRLHNTLNFILLSAIGASFIHKISEEELFNAYEGSI